MFRLLLHRRLWIITTTTIIILTFAGNCCPPVAQAFAASSSRSASPTRTTTVINSSSSSHSSSSSVVVTIERATIPDDLPAIRACRQTAFAPSPQEETAAVPFPRLASQISFCNATAVGTGAALCFVARDTSTSTTSTSTSSTSSSTLVLGTLDYKPTTRVIQNVLVRPTCRGQGLGRRLVEQCEAFVASSNSNKSNNNASIVLYLDVSTANTPAYSLYTSMGYAPDGPLHAVSAAIGSTLGTGLLVRMQKKIIV